MIKEYTALKNKVDKFITENYSSKIWERIPLDLNLRFKRFIIF